MMKGEREGVRKDRSKKERLRTETGYEDDGRESMKETGRERKKEEIYIPH